MRTWWVVACAALFSLNVHAAEPIADPDVDYGFGWRLSGDTVWHSGESIGFNNVIIRWPKQHVTVVILTNRNEFQPYPLALAIGQLFLDR